MLSLVFETHMKLGNLQCEYNFNRIEVLLLRIENIKTNQIGKFCQGVIKCTKKLPELLFLYPFPLNNRKIFSIINTDTSQMSLFNHTKTIWARNMQFWENYQHTLCVMCPVPHVRCHMSHVTFFFLQRGEVSLLRVCY